MVRNREQARQIAAQGRLLTRPSIPRQVTTKPPPGFHPLNLKGDDLPQTLRKRDGWLYVPQTYRATRPAPLVIMLHGAGGDAQGGLAPFQDLADAAGLILLAVDSRKLTWDVIRGQYGPDILFLDRALAHTFDRYAIDPSHIAIEGFSDGASYALSVGIMNGDLFTHVIAFSPGFAKPIAQYGIPRLFVSHGIHDPVLSIDYCSRRIVPLLQQADYDIHYREFDGSHTVPPEIAAEAIQWFTATPPGETLAATLL